MTPTIHNPLLYPKKGYNTNFNLSSNLQNTSLANKSLHSNLTNSKLLSKASLGSSLVNKSLAAGDVKYNPPKNLGNLNTSTLRTTLSTQYGKRIKLSSSGLSSTKFSTQFQGYGNVQNRVSTEEISSQDLPRKGLILTEISDDSDYNALPSTSVVYSDVDDQQVFPLPSIVESSENDSLEQLKDLKRKFINMVSGALIASPNFTDPNDVTVRNLKETMDQLSNDDPEFVLKVALYSRNRLNVRNSSNFITSYASTLIPCRPFLKKYFSSSINLPTDWLEVAEFYQSFLDISQKGKHGMIPAALRRVMAKKFTEFDSYQLGKYNKENSHRKKKFTIRFVRGKKIKTLKEVKATDKHSFTIKQIIRKIHISQPVDHVMSIIGKRYPMTAEEFSASKLPGIFDSSRAGKRMKLPVPETWETQISLRGNKAEVWQELLDHNKLPFMAMLRNLRNLLKAGVQQRYHDKVINKLTNINTVINSKQFPFRFFSAFEVLAGLEEDLKNSNEPKPVRTVKVKVGKRAAFVKKRPATIRYTLPQLQRYLRALNEAVRIATTYNLKPIPGRTLIFCNVSSQMRTPCTLAKGLGKPHEVIEVAILMGLMCQHCCENNSFYIYHESGFDKIEPQKGGILRATQTILSMASKSEPNTGSDPKFPHDILWNLIKNTQMIDNIIILSNESSEEGPYEEINSFLDKYRHTVNPNLLFVSIDLSGSKVKFASDDASAHPNDIYIAGFSDQILRYIAERGNAGQLLAVEKIDKAFGIDNIQVNKAISSQADEPMDLIDEAVIESIPKLPTWRRVKVFVSSTFLDMHGERDILTRYIFPELRNRLTSHFIDVTEIDLRWGVVEEQITQGSSMGLCLQQVLECDAFVGIIGDRYGYVPDVRMLADEDHRFNWIRQHAPDVSITELEFRQALRDNKPSFFFERSIKNKSEIPSDYASKFVDNRENLFKLANLKAYIERFTKIVKYEAEWGKVLDGKPMLTGLENFASSIIADLHEHFVTEFPRDAAFVDEFTQFRGNQNLFIQTICSNGNPRSTNIEECIRAIDRKSLEGGIVVVKGPSGIGKTFFMAHLHQHLQEKRPNVLYAHFISPSLPNSGNLVSIYKWLLQSIKQRCASNKDIPSDYRALKTVFEHNLEFAAYANRTAKTPFIFLLDGVEDLDDVYNAKSLDWMPSKFPKGVVFVISVESKTLIDRRIAERWKNEVMTIKELNALEKPALVRYRLAKFSKELNESGFNNQMKHIITKKDSIYPFYLSFCCEEIRLFGVYEKIDDLLKKLPSTTNQLMQNSMARLERELGFELVSPAFGLLCLSRKGLSETDLLTILSAMAHFKGVTSPSMKDIVHYLRSNSSVARLPQLLFKQLQHGLGLFFSTADRKSYSDLLTARHSLVHKAVNDKYFSSIGKDWRKSLHIYLAAYFNWIIDPNGDRMYECHNSRGFSEITHHLLEAGMFDSLSHLLTDFNFVKKKISHGFSAELISDYEFKVASSIHFIQEKATKARNLPELKRMLSFLTANLHILERAPELIYQQAMYFAGLESGSTNSKLIENVQWENKPEMQSPCTLVMTDFTDQVLCIATSPEKDVIAVGTKDCLIKFLNIETGKEIAAIYDLSSPVCSLAFAGSNKILSGTEDGEIHIWSLSDYHMIKKITTHKRRVSSVSADCFGSKIVSVSWDCFLVVWNINSVSSETSICASQCPINSVCCHPQMESLVVIGCWDGTVKIWDIFATESKYVFRGHKSSIRDAVYSPDGLRIISSAFDGEVRLWSADQMQQLCVLGVYNVPINKLAFVNDGRILIGACEDKKIRAWSGTMGKKMYTLKPSESTGASTCVAFDSKASELVVGYQNGLVKTFNLLNSGVELESHQVTRSSIDCVGWFPRTIDLGKVFAAGTHEGHVVLFRSNKQVDTQQLHSGAVICMCMDDVRAYRKQKPLLVTGGHDGFVKISEITSEYKLSDLYSMAAHSGPVNSVLLYGHYLYTGSRDRQINFYDLKKIKKSVEPKKRMVDAHSDWVTSLAMIDGRLISGSSDCRLNLYSKELGEVEHNFCGHSSAITSLFGFDKVGILSADTQGFVKVWTKKGGELTSFLGISTQRSLGMDVSYSSIDSDNIHDDPENDVTDWAYEVDTADDHEALSRRTVNKQSSFDFSKVLLAITEDNGDVSVWQPLVGTEFGCLLGHTSSVTDIGITNHNQLFSSGLDNSVRRWRMEENYIHSPPALKHLTSITSIALTDLFVVSGDRSGLIQVFTLGNMELIASVKAHDSVVSDLKVAPKKRSSSSPLLEFYSSGLDKCIYKWSLAKQKNVYYFESMLPTSYTASSPVTCLGVTENSVYFGNWKNELVHLTPMLVFVETIHESSKPDWMLSISVSPSLILSTTANLKSTIAFNPDKKNQLVDFTVIWSNENLQEHISGNVWITASVINSNNVILGTSSGYLTVFNKNRVLLLKKIHENDIVAIRVFHTKIVTAGKDGIIKVWTAKSFKQVSEFHAASAVTALEIVHHDAATVYCVASDELGHVYKLIV